MLTEPTEARFPNGPDRDVERQKFAHLVCIHQSGTYDLPNTENLVLYFGQSRNDSHICQIPEENTKSALFTVLRCLFNFPTVHSAADHELAVDAA